MLLDNLKCFIIERKLNNIRRLANSIDPSEVKRIIEKADWKILDLIVKFKLFKTLKHSTKNTPWYKNKISESIANISLNNVYLVLEKIPFTYPGDISINPELFLSIPYENVSSFHFTAGTTGKRKKLYLSKSDIDMVIYNYYLGLLMQYLNRNDIVQVMYSFGLWQLGNIYQQALNRLGIKCLPTGNEISFNDQAQFITDFKTSIIIGTPSYIYQLAREVDLPRSNREKIKSVVCGGEHLSNKKREYIENKLGGKVNLAYGMMEFGGGIGSECDNCNGYHILTTVHPEIVDIKTGDPVEKEEFGELVLTSLDRIAMPLLRYKTGDITRFIDGECDCGLNLRRIDYIKNRTDDRVTIGTAEKYYPIIFEDIIESIEEIKDFQIEIVKSEERDTLRVNVVADKPSENLKLKIIRKFYEIASFKKDIEKTKTINTPEIIFTDKIDNQGIKKRFIIDKRTNS